MKQRDNNRINMVNAVIGFCDNHTADTSGISAFANTLFVIKAKMVLVNSLNQIGSGNTKGVTADTNLLRETMTELALKCGSATLAFANSQHNNTLAALVNFTRNKLNKLKKEDVDDVCQGMKDATAGNIAGAMSYGVGASDVSDLQAAIDLYRQKIQSPRQAIISRSQAKKQVSAMVREVIDFLLEQQLDVMVNTLKIGNRNFCSGYKLAREIIDLGTVHTKAKGDVRDVNDVPLAGVLFSVYEAGTTKLIAKVLTNKKGRDSVTKLPHVNFDLRWELEGYVTLSESGVHIKLGKVRQRKVVMEPLPAKTG